MGINRNFVTMVGLTNDERCLIHNLRVEKYQVLKKIYENVFKKVSTFRL